MLGGVPHQGGLHSQSGWVTRFSGVSFRHVKAAEWGNPPNLGKSNQSSVANYFGDFTSKTTKTLMKLTVLAKFKLGIGGIKVKFCLQQRHQVFAGLHFL